MITNLDKPLFSNLYSVKKVDKRGIVILEILIYCIEENLIQIKEKV